MKHALFGLCAISLGVSAAAVPSLVGAAETGQPVIQSVTVVPDGEKRAAGAEQRMKIVKIVGSVPIPDEMKPTSSPAQLDELRDQVVQQAKKLALDRASQDLAAGSGAPGWSIRQPRPEDVYVIQLTDLPLENNRFSLVMVAEVRFGLEQKPADQPVTTDTARAKSQSLAEPEVPHSTTELPSSCDADNCLTTRVSTDKTVYTVGEQVVIHLVANRNFYGVVYYEEESGKQIQVLPNAFRSANFFRGGTDYVIPGEGDKFKLVVTKPVGIETIRLRASPQPLPLEAIPTTPMADGRKIVDVLPQETARLTRSLMVMATEPAAENRASMPGADKKSVQLNEATWELETKLSELLPPKGGGRPKGAVNKATMEVKARRRHQIQNRQHTSKSGRHGPFLLESVRKVR